MPIQITITPPEGQADEITLRLRLEFENPPAVEDDEYDFGPQEGPDDWEWEDEPWYPPGTP